MPSILAIWVASYIQKFFTKITPDVIKVFVVPFFTLLITVPLTFLVVGPIANAFSDGLTSLFQAIMNFSPIVFGLVLGILWQVLVMFGMHWALVPLAILDVATNGSSTILSAAILPCFTQTGVLGAIMLKTKEEKSPYHLYASLHFIYFWGDRTCYLWGNPSNENAILHFMWCFRTYGGCHDGLRY